MIKEFVDIFMNNKPELRDKLKDFNSCDYDDLIKIVFGLLTKHSDAYEKPDLSRLTVINHGDYQGTLVYVIGSDGYQPSTYWAVSVYYGSCSGCDTLQAVLGYDDNPLTEGQINELETLCLHIVQGIKKI